MANQTMQKAVIIGSVAVTAFFTGKFQERNNFSRQNYKVYPALPLFGSVSVGDNLDEEFQKQSLRFPLNKFNNLFRRLGFDFGSVKAASPVPERSVPMVLPTTDPSKSNRVSQIMKYGFPSLDNVRSYDNYVLSYDQRNRVAHWVFEHLTPESVRKSEGVDRSKCDFMPDESIHAFFRSQNSDYKRSGFDRGHLAAAGNHQAYQKCVEQTFYLTNIAPQVGKGFNRDSWNRLEKYVRKLTKNYPNVYCCTGPLYLPRVWFFILLFNF